MRELSIRLYELFIKLVSVKGLVLALATVLCMHGRIDGTTWMIAAGVIVGARAYEKKQG
jgi:hypothetical protein